MTPEISEYSDLIERLKPMVNEPEFNQVLAQVAGNLTRDKRFLLKINKQLFKLIAALISKKYFSECTDNMSNMCALYSGCVCDSEALVL